MAARAESDAALAHIPALDNVRRLVVTGKAVTDGGLRHLAGLQRLTSLTIDRAGITDAGLVHLKGLSGLVELRLLNVPVTDKGLANLASLKNLRRLTLWHTRATARSAADLKKSIPEIQVALVAAPAVKKPPAKATPPAFTALAAPVLRAADPAMIARGSSANVRLNGEHLRGAVQALVRGASGVWASLVKTADKQVIVRVTARSDAPAGARTLRLVTPGGVSEPVAIEVVSLPVTGEREPNNERAKAQSVTLPALLIGTIGAKGDADAFRFQAKKGERLVFDVQAARAGSKLDASLFLHGAGGNLVAQNEDTNGFDPLIVFTPPADGEYVLTIRDLQYRGGGDYRYRIRAGVVPYVDGVFPLGGRRGRVVQVQLTGHNLNGAATMPIALGPADPLGARPVAARTKHGASNKRSFEVGDLPEAVEQEPNDDGKQANDLKPPVVMNGRIERDGDVDRFRFKPPKKGTWIVEVRARRLGSPLDALLTLSDDQGKVIATNDDASGADARIEAKNLDPARVYTVAVRDLVDRGGPAYAYRLSVAPPPPKPAPDFALRLHPDRLRVSRGSRTKVWCHVRRIGGFQGDVTVSLEGLPSGVTCAPVVMPGNKPTSGLFVVGASADAPLGAYPLRLHASGTVGGGAVRRTLTGPGGETEIWLTVLGAPAFTVRAVGPETAADRNKRLTEIARLGSVLATQTPALDREQAAWEKKARQGLNWTVLVPVRVTTSGPSKPVVRPDGTVELTGPNPNRDTVTVVVETDVQGITGFQLDAIAKDGRGPGRAPNGNFVLSSFTVQAADLGAGKGKADVKPRPKSVSVALRNPKSDFSQNGFNVSYALKPAKDKGWAVHPHGLKSHWATFETAAPLRGQGRRRLTFVLKNVSVHKQHVLGIFRLAVTTAKQVRHGKSLPAAVGAIVRTDASKRTAKQRETLAAHHRSIAPSLNTTRAALAGLRVQGSDYPPRVKRGGSAVLRVDIPRAPGFTGEINVTVEGFSAGVDGKTKGPVDIRRDVDVKPVKLKGTATRAALRLAVKGKAQQGTGNIVVKATSKIGGVEVVEYGGLIPLTVE